MAAVEPQERARELNFLLRLLTERLPPDTGGYAQEARSYPIGEWARSPIGLSAADAINLSMGIVGPKVKLPRTKKSVEPVAGAGGATESAVIASRLKSMSEMPTARPASDLIKGRAPETKMTEGGKWLDVENDFRPSPQKYDPIAKEWVEFARRGTPTTATPAEILAQTKEKGGYSVNLETGEVPREGIMAGKFANADPRTRVIEGDPTMVDITNWIKQNEKLLKGPKAERTFIGTWKDPASGKTYLDVAQKFPPEAIRPATKFAERTGQISMYNAGTGEFPPVGNFRENLVGPEVRERWREAGKWGEDYMTAQNLPEWWDTPYFRQIYGEKIARENVPGFLGAVSTNTRPRPNVQGASEYLRRLIKGEPTLQPDYRVPETAMGGFSGPGKQMGLEAGRAYNLLKAAEGETRGAEYRGPVVQEKVEAFAGDPNAAVIDRLHMRPVEDPARGIYATTQAAETPGPGVRSSPSLPERGPDRQLLKEEMLKEATSQGKTLRRLSAEIWAGLRERIKSHGEVWGVKGTGSPDESFSYNDHLIQLVKDKAKHLGISIQEMEKRLGSGDAELLSYLLATPIGAELYKLSRGSQSEVVGTPSDVAP